jgi:hypothetical protein
MWNTYIKELEKKSLNSNIINRFDEQTEVEKNQRGHENNYKIPTIVVKKLPYLIYKGKLHEIALTMQTSVSYHIINGLEVASTNFTNNH